MTQNAETCQNPTFEIWPLECKNDVFCDISESINRLDLALGKDAHLNSWHKSHDNFCGKVKFKVTEVTFKVKIDNFSEKYQYISLIFLYLLTAYTSLLDFQNAT